MAKLFQQEMKNTNKRGEILSPEQIKQIKGLWNTMGLPDIAEKIGVSVEAVSSFARTHYLYFNYLR